MIAIQYYADIFYHVGFIMVLFSLMHTVSNTGKETMAIYLSSKIAFVLTLGLVLYIGLRPINWRFVDMVTYDMSFKMSTGRSLVLDGTYEWLFASFMWLSAQLMSSSIFFFLCTLLYIVPLYGACKRWFNRYNLWAFLMVIGSFSFFAYGVNGIRNGIATSLVILAMTYYSRKFIMVLIFIIAMGMHQSVLLPILAFLIGYSYRSSKVILIVWLLSIPLSLVAGGKFEQIFASIGFANDKLVGYLTTAAGEQFSSSGFRWDFLLYSSVPVVLGYHYIFQKGYRDKIYLQIYNTYLVSNAFWILVIRASFSNRFAYLSWFLIPIILIYPLLKKRIWINQFGKMGGLIFLHYLFTYIMFFVYN